MSSESFLLSFFQPGPPDREHRELDAPVSSSPLTLVQLVAWHRDHHDDLTGSQSRHGSDYWRDWAREGTTIASCG